MNPTNRKNRTVQLSGNTEQVKDWQMTGKIKRNRIFLKEYPRRVPVEIWEEIPSNMIHYSYGNTYLVTKQGDK